MQQSDHIAATVQICPRCGAEFSGGPGLKNLCPRCLMQSVLADSAAPDESAPSEELDVARSASGAQPDRNTPTGFQFRSGDRVLDGYTIVAPVGRGGFGEVYHARSDVGKDVALKFVQRFLEVEMRGVGHCLNLKHPNLVTIFDARPDSAGQQWIVMEFVAGRSLAHAIDRTPRGLPIEEILHWLEGITAAVEHLHESGIVHRDLKPSNIFDDRSTVKVGDYGLAKFITASRRSGQTQSIGTLHYMAPEIGCGRYGREVDVYAVGIMLYEMLTGDVPLDGETPAEILMKHLTAPPDLTMLPSAFRGIVGRMLAKRPEERYGSLRAVMADLKARLADAASGQFEPGEDLPYYSSPGVSTWLEAPLATFQQQFAAARHGPPDRDAGVPESARQRQPRTVITIHPAHKGLGLLLALITLTFPFYLATGQVTGFLIAIPFVLIVALIAWTAFDVWAGFLRKRMRPGNSDHGFDWHRDSASVLTSSPLRHDSVRPPLRAVQSSSEYSFTAATREIDHERTPPHDEPPGVDPAAPGTWLGVLGAILIAIFWGVGTGLLVAGTSLLIWPRADEVAALCSIGAGFLVASVITIRCLFSVGVSAFLRLMAAMFCGASVGLATFGLSLLTQAGHGFGLVVVRVHDETAALHGVGAGLLAAGLLALRFFGGRPQWLLWRTFAGLLAGIGAGLFCAGLLVAWGVRPDEFVALPSLGVGLLTGGWIWLALLVQTRRYAALRVLTALVNGAGVGLLVAAMTLLGSSEEAAAFLGIGAGFVACGVIGFRLLVTARAPAWR